MTDRVQEPPPGAWTALHWSLYVGEPSDSQLATLRDLLEWLAEYGASPHASSNRVPGRMACSYGEHDFEVRDGHNVCKRCGAVYAIPNRATVCDRCGSGLLDGKHIASYPPCNGVDATSKRAAEDVISNIIRAYDGKGLSASVFAEYIVTELRARGFDV